MLASISLSVKGPVKVVSCSVVKVSASVSIYMLQITAAQLLSRQSEVSRCSVETREEETKQSARCRLCIDHTLRRQRRELSQPVPPRPAPHSEQQQTS